MGMGSPPFSFDDFFSRPLSGVISEPWLTAKPEVATTKGTKSTKSTKNTKLRSEHYFVSFVCFPFAKASGNGPSCGSEPPGGVP